MARVDTDVRPGDTVLDCGANVGVYTRHALERGAQRTVERFRPRMAISLEHRPIDIEEIPALIRSLWPSLKTECGSCVWVGTALVDRVQPDVLYVGP